MLWNDATTGMMLADTTTGLMKSCACCPCVEWGIAYLCPRRYVDCPDGSPGDCVPSVTLYDSDLCHEIKKAFLYGKQLSRVEWGDTYTPEANGSVELKLYFDGVLIKTQTVNFLYDVPLVLALDGMAVNMEMGAHRITVVATFSDDTENPLEWCACILVISDDIPRDLTNRSVVPWTLDPCVDEDYELVMVKGPFATPQDADYVNATFDYILSDYIRACRCPELECGPSDDAMNGYWESDGAEQGDIFGQSWVCETEMTWHIDYNVEGGVIFLEGEDGTPYWRSDDAPEGDFVIPACTEVHFTLDSHTGTGICSINVYNNGQTPPPDCPFCSNAEWALPSHGWCVYHRETKEGEWLSDWTYTGSDDGGPHGIPSNSDELKDYLESLEV